ncbi:transposable element Tc1 transposase [Trichonephila clavipes]|nr:transposable element Tc1 transposase [Trichonephila clavipes]
MHTVEPDYSGAWLDQVGIMLTRDAWSSRSWKVMSSHSWKRDEFRFQLWPDDHRRRVWRRPGQRVDPACTIAGQLGPQAEVMIWGAISFDSRAPLVVVKGTLAAQRYVDDIQITVLLPFICNTLASFFSKIMPAPIRKIFC